jgi:malic enzyme
MAVFTTEASGVTEEMFIVAAKAVAEQVTEENLASGLIYPPPTRQIAQQRPPAQKPRSLAKRGAVRAVITGLHDVYWLVKDPRRRSGPGAYAGTVIH